jgi:hypothetical protein
MEIPLHGERWSKGMPLDALCYEEFIKPNCLNEKVETVFQVDIYRSLFGNS